MATRAGAAGKSENLMVRLDPGSKKIVTRAARLRGVTASDYVRTTVVAQARRDVDEAGARVIRLSAEEQLEFWRALQAPAPLTTRQRRLGRLMRGER